MRNTSQTNHTGAHVTKPGQDSVKLSTLSKARKVGKIILNKREHDNQMQ
jgi:hypothetical protein